MAETVVDPTTTWGMCFEYDARNQFRDAWGYLLQESGVPFSWERNTPEASRHQQHQWTQFLDSLDQIKNPLVVLSPLDGTWVSGENSLYELDHPADAVYWFGSDRSDMRVAHFGDRPYRTVYIPDSGYMHSFTAAAMVVYDRKYKQWQ